VQQSLQLCPACPWYPEIRHISWGRLVTWLYSPARGPTSRLLLGLINTFTGWVEAFPCSSEKAWEVIKVLINEVIPRFGLPWTLQSDNGPAFQVEVTDGISKDLGIKCYLHSAWRPQSSCKVELANGLLKKHLSKLAQETHLPWPSLLPLALTWFRNTTNSLSLTPFEALHGRPFLRNDLLLNYQFGVPHHPANQIPMNSFWAEMRWTKGRLFPMILPRQYGLS
jgi:hypothetical protein